MNKSKLKISVIIPTLNSWSTLRSCVVSVYNQSFKPFGVIVVDNGSSDGTSEKIRREFPKVKLVTLKRNTGVTGGRNVGIKIASKKSDYLLFLDHDVIADKNMLLNLVKVAEMDKSYGIITPKIFYWENRGRIWAAGTNINLWTGQILFRGGRDYGQFEKIEEVQVAPAVILVKRKALDQIGGFDDKYFATYEDTDFCFRAKDYNFKTIYAPEAIAFHKISPQHLDEQKRLLDRSFWIGRNRVLFMKDYGKSYYLFLFFSIMYMLYFIKMSIEQRNLNGLVNYIKGYTLGIIQSKKT